jgi:hypothetical protein
MLCMGGDSGGGRSRGTGKNEHDCGVENDGRSRDKATAGRERNMLSTNSPFIFFPSAVLSQKLCSFQAIFCRKLVGIHEIQHRYAAHGVTQNTSSCGTNLELKQTSRNPAPEMRILGQISPLAKFEFKFLIPDKFEPIVGEFHCSRDRSLTSRKFETNSL